MNIVLTGSIAFDYLMTFPGLFKDHILPDKLDSISLSFLVDSMVVQRGGNAPNVAYSMALLGGKPRIMASAGEDFAEYGAWLESKGIDTTGIEVVKGVNTASFFANTDQSNAQIASFYPGAMTYASQLSFKDLAGPKPDLVLISPNDPTAMVKYVEECRQLEIDYFYDPGQQIIRLSPDDLRVGIEGARGLFVNDYEYSLIEKATGMDESDILKTTDFLVVTRGEKGSDIFTNQGQIHIPVYPELQKADPTGIGDAFRGGFLVGYERGWDLPLCCRVGSLAATYCLETGGPQSHDFTLESFISRFRLVFDDENKLDELSAT